MGRLLCGIFILSSFVTSVYAIDPTRSWYSFETSNFIIHYNQENKQLAKKTAVIAEKAHKDLSSYLNWQPEEKTHLVISDETDLSNGYATPYYYNRSVLFVSPPDYPNSLEDFDSWLELLITHEYAHILHLDKGAGIVKGFRNIFGRHVFLFPNFYQPPWLIEGFATQVETRRDDNKNKGVGRGQSSYFEMMMRMEVLAGVKPLEQINIPFRSWPGRTSSYLYGVYFYQFMEDVYGKDVVINLIDNYSRHLIPFMINSNSIGVVNKDFNELWSEFVIWLERRFEENIVDTKTMPVVAGSRISHQGYYTDQVKALKNGGAYYIGHGAYDHSVLMRINVNDQEEAVVDVHPLSRIDVHKDSILLAQPEYCNNYNLNYDLYVYSLKDENLKRITRCGRYRSAAWSVDGEEIIAVKQEAGKSEIHLLDAEGKLKDIILQEGINTIIGQPDWSNDKRYIVASVFRESSGWNIERYDLKNRRWQKLTSDSAIDVYPEFDNDSNNIIFSSDRNGIYNIYQLNIKDGTINQLTHVMGGAFKSSKVGKELFYVGYNESGNDIYKINNTEIISKQKIEFEIDKVKNDKHASYRLDMKVRDYSPWQSMRPRWWEPIIFIDEQKTELGFVTGGHDALEMHNYLFGIANDSYNEILTGFASYGYIDRFLAGVSRESSILNDATGNYAATVLDEDYYLYWLNPFRNFESSWNFIIGAQSGVSKEHKREPWIPPLGELQNRYAGAAVLFSNSKYYPKSISQLDGRSIKLVYENSDAWQSDYTGEVYTLDWREYIQIHKEHVFALRVAGGWGTEITENFRLGGEDSDHKLLDFLGVNSEKLFGDRDYMLRGYAEGLPQLAGRRMKLGSMEYRFPLGLVERGFMTPPVGLIQWSGSVFMETGAAWDIGQTPDTYYSSVGIELHADVNLFYRLNTHMRLGYASGLDDILGEDRVYFSLGGSF
ncbi:MAG: hypothetical protein OEZ38_05920 [Gammaproteobacteria bacterium]|nr:hypothetical protein [Gammaproteobacteria bacterium]